MSELNFLVGIITFWLFAKALHGLLALVVVAMERTE